MRHSIFTGSIVAIALLFLGACSSSDDAVLAPVDSTAGPRALAEEMIAGDLSTALGLGPLVGSCNDPGPLAVGTAFTCTATGEPGPVIQIDGMVNAEGRIELTTSNVITAVALPSFEREAAAALNNSIGSNFTANAVDCGSTTIVLPADFVLGCALIMPASAEEFDLSLTITDLDARIFSLQVAEEPRP